MSTAVSGPAVRLSVAQRLRMLPSVALFAAGVANGYVGGRLRPQTPLARDVAVAAGAATVGEAIFQAGLPAETTLRARATIAASDVGAFAVGNLTGGALARRHAAKSARSRQAM